MPIREKLLYVSQSIILDLQLSFQEYFSESLVVTFEGEYPRENEDLISIGTLLPTVEISGQKFSIWTDEFQKLIDKSLPRKYHLKLGAVHNLCFDSLCCYFEVLSSRVSTEIAQQNFDNFYFYLQIQLKCPNVKYVFGYKRYWKEFLGRLIGVFESQQTSFYGLFDKNDVPGIIANLKRAKELVDDVQGLFNPQPK